MSLWRAESSISLCCMAVQRRDIGLLHISGWAQISTVHSCAAVLASYPNWSSIVLFLRTMWKNNLKNVVTRMAKRRPNGIHTQAKEIQFFFQGKHQITKNGMRHASWPRKFSSNQKLTKQKSCLQLCLRLIVHYEEHPLVCKMSLSLPAEWLACERDLRDSNLDIKFWFQWTPVMTTFLNSKRQFVFDDLMIVWPLSTLFIFFFTQSQTKQKKTFKNVQHFTLGK